MTATVNFLCGSRTVVFSPKGWDNLAQGNALGQYQPMFGSLKGCDRPCPRLSAWKTKHL